MLPHDVGGDAGEGPEGAAAAAAAVALWALVPAAVTAVDDALHSRVVGVSVCALLRRLR